VAVSIEMSGHGSIGAAICSLVHRAYLGFVSGGLNVKEAKEVSLNSYRTGLNNYQAR